MKRAAVILALVLVGLGAGCSVDHDHQPTQKQIDDAQDDISRCGSAESFLAIQEDLNAGRVQYDNLPRASRELVDCYG